MKKIIQTIASIALIAMVFFSTSLMSQPDPGGGGDPGGGIPPVGGGGAGGGAAPVGDGLAILIILVVSYTLYKMYNLGLISLRESKA
jgi:hypothetical protein